MPDRENLTLLLALALMFFGAYTWVAPSVLRMFLDASSAEAFERSYLFYGIGVLIALTAAAVVVAISQRANRRSPPR